MENGLMHIYHGNGKGKTTAAVGLAVRAAGAGMSVMFAQFMKNGKSSELDVLRGIEKIEVNVVENTYGFTWNMTDADRQELKVKNDSAVSSLLPAVETGQYRLLVLDEIVSAYQCGLADKEQVLSLIKLCRGRTELVLTGRNPPDELLEQADYSTEMKCVRHPYEKGINARPGIEL